MNHLSTVSYDIDQGKIKGKVVLLYEYREAEVETCHTCGGDRTRYKPFLVGIGSVEDSNGDIVFPQLSEHVADNEDEDYLNTTLWLELAWKAKEKLEGDSDLDETTCDCDLVPDLSAPIISGERDTPKYSPKSPQDVGVDIKLDPEE